MSHVPYPNHLFQVLPHHFTIKSAQISSFIKYDDHISFVCQATADIILPQELAHALAVAKYHGNLNESGTLGQNFGQTGSNFQSHTFTWQFRRRYSDFVFLHSRLGPEFCYSDEGNGLKLPPLPEKQWFGNFNREFVQQRKRQLHRYLHDLIVQPSIAYYPYFLQFIGCPGEGVDYPLNANLPPLDASALTQPISSMPPLLMVSSREIWDQIQAVMGAESITGSSSNNNNIGFGRNLAVYPHDDPFPLSQSTTSHDSRGHSLLQHSSSGQGDQLGNLQTLPTNYASQHASHMVVLGEDLMKLGSLLDMNQNYLSGTPLYDRSSSNLGNQSNNIDSGDQLSHLNSPQAQPITAWTSQLSIPSRALIQMGSSGAIRRDNYNNNNNLEKSNSNLSQSTLLFDHGILNQPPGTSHFDKNDMLHYLNLPLTQDQMGSMQFLTQNEPNQPNQPSVGSGKKKGQNQPQQNTNQSPQVLTEALPCIPRQVCKEIRGSLNALSFVTCKLQESQAQICAILTDVTRMGSSSMLNDQQFAELVALGTSASNSNLSNLTNIIMIEEADGVGQESSNLTGMSSNFDKNDPNAPSFNISAAGSNMTTSTTGTATTAKSFRSSDVVNGDQRRGENGQKDKNGKNADSPRSIAFTQNRYSYAKIQQENGFSYIPDDPEDYGNPNPLSNHHHHSNLTDFAHVFGPQGDHAHKNGQNLHSSQTFAGTPTPHSGSLDGSESTSTLGALYSQDKFGGQPGVGLQYGTLGPNGQANNENFNNQNTQTNQRSYVSADLLSSPSTLDLDSSVSAQHLGPQQSQQNPQQNQQHQSSPQHQFPNPVLVGSSHGSNLQPSGASHLSTFSNVITEVTSPLTNYTSYTSATNNTAYSTPLSDKSATNSTALTSDHTTRTDGGRKGKGSSRTDAPVAKQPVPDGGKVSWAQIATASNAPSGNSGTNNQQQQQSNQRSSSQQSQQNQFNQQNQNDPNVLQFDKHTQNLLNMAQSEVNELKNEHNKVRMQLFATQKRLQQMCLRSEHQAALISNYQDREKNLVEANLGAVSAIFNEILQTQEVLSQFLVNFKLKQTELAHDINENCSTNRIPIPVLDFAGGGDSSQMSSLQSTMDSQQTQQHSQNNGQNSPTKLRKGNSTQNLAQLAGKPSLSGSQSTIITGNNTDLGQNSQFLGLSANQLHPGTQTTPFNSQQTPNSAQFQTYSPQTCGQSIGLGSSNPLQIGPNAKQLTRRASDSKTDPKLTENAQSIPSFQNNGQNGQNGSVLGQSPTKSAHNDWTPLHPNQLQPTNSNGSTQQNTPQQTGTQQQQQQRPPSSNAGTPNFLSASTTANIKGSKRQSSRNPLYNDQTDDPSQPITYLGATMSGGSHSGQQQHNGQNLAHSGNFLTAAPSPLQIASSHSLQTGPLSPHSVSSVKMPNQNSSRFVVQGQNSPKLGQNSPKLTQFADGDRLLDSGSFSATGNHVGGISMEHFDQNANNSGNINTTHQLMGQQRIMNRFPLELIDMVEHYRVLNREQKGYFRQTPQSVLVLKALRQNTLFYGDQLDSENNQINASGNNNHNCNNNPNRQIPSNLSLSRGSKTDEVIGFDSTNTSQSPLKPPTMTTTMSTTSSATRLQRANSDVTKASSRGSSRGSKNNGQKGQNNGGNFDQMTISSGSRHFESEDDDEHDLFDSDFEQPSSHPLNIPIPPIKLGRGKKQKGNKALNSNNNLDRDDNNHQNNSLSRSIARLFVATSINQFNTTSNNNNNINSNNNISVPFSLTTSHATSRTLIPPSLIGDDEFAFYRDQLLTDSFFSRYMDILIKFLSPTKQSLDRYTSIFQYVSKIGSNALGPGSVLYPHGSFALRTYLPDGDIDLSCFVPPQNNDQQQHGPQNHPNNTNNNSTTHNDDANPNAWCMKLIHALGNEALQPFDPANKSKPRVQNFSLINAQVKVVNTTVAGLSIDISTNKIGALTALALFEDIDRIVGQNHLFKRSLILARAVLQSEFLGSTTGLFSTYCLRTMVLYLFNIHYYEIDSPMYCLYKLFQLLSTFPFSTHVLTIYGPIPTTQIHTISSVDAVYDIHFKGISHGFGEQRGSHGQFEHQNHPQNHQQNNEITITLSTAGSDQVDNQMNNNQSNIQLPNQELDYPERAGTYLPDGSFQCNEFSQFGGPTYLETPPPLISKAMLQGYMDLLTPNTTQNGGPNVHWGYGCVNVLDPLAFNNNIGRTVTLDKIQNVPKIAQNYLKRIDRMMKVYIFYMNTLWVDVVTTRNKIVQHYYDKAVEFEANNNGQNCQAVNNTRFNAQSTPVSPIATPSTAIVMPTSPDTVSQNNQHGVQHNPNGPNTTTPPADFTKLINDFEHNMVYSWDEFGQYSWYSRKMHIILQQQSHLNHQYLSVLDTKSQRSAVLLATASTVVNRALRNGGFIRNSSQQNGQNVKNANNCPKDQNVPKQNAHNLNNLSTLGLFLSSPTEQTSSSASSSATSPQTTRPNSPNNGLIDHFELDQQLLSTTPYFTIAEALASLTRERSLEDTPATSNQDKEREGEKTVVPANVLTNTILYTNSLFSLVPLIAKDLAQVSITKYSTPTRAFDQSYQLYHYGLVSERAWIASYYENNKLKETYLNTILPVDRERDGSSLQRDSSFGIGLLGANGVGEGIGKVRDESIRRLDYRQPIIPRNGWE